MTDATSGTATDYSSGGHEFNRSFCEDRISCIIVCPLSVKISWSVW